MKRGPKPSPESLELSKQPPRTAEELVLELVKALGYYAVEWDELGLTDAPPRPPVALAVPTDALFRDQGKRARIALIMVNDWTKRRDLNLQAAGRRKTGGGR